ncbi:MAG: Orotidine 5'-phosphate decarboxylase [Gammaproteobacteria bacterium]|nr:Orotidine 5'-phosphate decarboxylase [Gammaproteobacteria bacterium]
MLYNRISMPNDIRISERLIVALDYPTQQQARALVEQLGGAVHFYKVGLELFMDDACFDFVDWLRNRDKSVFVDLKFFDVPATVGRAVRRLNGRGIRFATVHGNDAMMRAAAEAKEDFQVLAVTVLTSLDRGDLDDLGFDCDVEQLVISRARRAVECGCDGVVASGQETRSLRQALGGGFLVVTPGIRPLDNDDDQKRIVNTKQAFDNGADYIVVGRPIRDAVDPFGAAQHIQSEIAAMVDSRLLNDQGG